MQQGDIDGALRLLRRAMSEVESDVSLDGLLDASYCAHMLWSLGEPEEASQLFRFVATRTAEVALQIDALRMLATRADLGAVAVADGMEAWRLLQLHRTTLDPAWWRGQSSHVLQVTALAASAAGDLRTAILSRSDLLTSGAAQQLPPRARGSLYLHNARDARKLGSRASSLAWYDWLFQNEPEYFGGDGERLLVLVERARVDAGAHNLPPGQGGALLAQELMALWMDPEFSLVAERAIVAADLAWELRGIGDWQLAGAVDADSVSTLDTLFPNVRAGASTRPAIRMAYEGSMLQAAEWHLRRGETSAGEQKLLWLAANATEGEYARIARRRLDQVSAGR
ncbi:MAG: hypothetical protein IT439_09875 [Phycisphaerales bacterium]|nr:hypothetical protein [Phycisphaerales bacterium]